MAHGGFDPVVLRDAYDAVAPEYAEKFGNDLDHLPLDTELLARLAAAADGGLVLDIGCGPAQGGGYLAARRAPPRPW
jgi:hypothetical protein